MKDNEFVSENAVQFMISQDELLDVIYAVGCHQHQQFMRTQMNLNQDWE